MSRRRHAPVKWDCPLLVPQVLREDIPVPNRTEKNIAKQLQLASIYVRLFRRTGVERFKHVATREANTAERMMRRI